jgi:DNA-directed RNA polymerase specialized sigma24 family protein
MRSSHPTLRRLNAEWQKLAEAPVPSCWGSEPPLAEAADLAGVLASVRAAPDVVLGALLRCGDATAHRVVLQAMLGGVVLDAARDPLHDLDEYVAELWLRIATYPLVRRPGRIAANLVLDTRKRVRGRLVPPVDPAELAGSAQGAEDAGPSPADLVLAEARRAALITAETERALRLVYTEGLATGQAAIVLGVAPAALRQRCSRAVRRLAAHSRELLEAIA